MSFVREANIAFASELNGRFFRELGYYSSRVPYGMRQRLFWRISQFVDQARPARRSHPALARQNNLGFKITLVGSRPKSALISMKNGALGNVECHPRRSECRFRVSS